MKKNKIESGALYSILHSGKDQNSSTFSLYDDQNDPVKGYLGTLLEFTWSKIHEKHATLAQAFRTFDIRNKGFITKSDFIFGLESLKIKLSTADIDMVFGYLDKSRDNQITYSEFCNMCEEKRRDIDPFREYQDT